MSFPILTSGQYDAAKYSPVGSVVVNRVESLSIMRSGVAGMMGIFGGKNTLIQGAVDELQINGLAEFTTKVQSLYPNTVLVVGLTSDIQEIGRGDQSTMYMVLTLSGTCLVPLGQTAGKRKTFKRRR
jgi:uncharacterized protein YbjQ (UPF0145 family)